MVLKPEKKRQARKFMIIAKLFVKEKESTTSCSTDEELGFFSKLTRVDTL